MSRRHDIQDATGRIEYLAGLGTVQAWGRVAPTNGVTGFAPGCIYHNLAGTAGTVFYVNIGTFTSSAWLEVTSMLAFNLSRAYATTALNTVGAGTITAAGIVNGVTLRGGAQAGSAFTDTTDTATALVTAMGSNATIGQSWFYEYQNNTNAQATLTGGTGVTVSGVTIVPKNTSVVFLVTYTAAATFTIVGVEMNQNVVIPPTQFVTTAAGNGTNAAGDLEGAMDCTYASSGATATTTRTAAQMIANIPNAQVGFSYRLRVYNTNAGTLTLTGGSSVTITGTATIATNVWRDYYVTITGASTVGFQNIGSGTAN